MAVTTDAKMVEVLAPTSSVNSPLWGPLYVNMQRLHQAWMTRPGMGQMAQFDCNLTAVAGTEFYGFSKLLGSYVLRTNFDHIQIVNVILADVTPNATPRQSSNRQAYIVAVYDVTSDQTYQQVLYAHSAATVANPGQMTTVIQHWPESPSSPLLAVIPAVDEQIGFAEYQDSLVMVAPSMGAWLYSPVDFDGVRDPLQIDGWRGNNGTTPYASPRGESPCVTPIVATTGINPDASYLDSGGFPRATCVTVIGGAVVYAADRAVYFSEAGKPGSIPSDFGYILNVQMQNPIIAIAQNNGYLYIFSNTETWVCQTDPSSPAAGQLTQLSYDIGCVGPNAITRVESTLVWASMHDIHSIAGGPYNVSSICDELRPLFDDRLANPLTSYYQTLGKIGPQNALNAELMYWDWKSLENVTLSYDYRLRTLYVSVPNGRFVLVRQTEQNAETWAIWTFESIVQELQTVNPPSANIGVIRRLTDARVLCLEGRVWLTSGMDAFVPPASWIGANPPSGSLVLCEQGRGGALDRSSIPDEDKRSFAGQWDLRNTPAGSTTKTAYMVIDRPRYMPVDTLYPVSGRCPSESVCYPVRVLSSETIDKVQLLLPLNGDFVPIMRTDTDVDVVINADRFPSKNAFSVTWDGSLLTLTWDPALAPNQWQTWPHMNNPIRQECILLWIPFVLSGQNQTPQNIGYTPGQLASQAFINDVQCSLSLWSEPMPSTLKAPEDYYARPVDWQAKTAQIGADGTQQVKTRGIFAHMLTTGSSDEKIVAPWVHGLLNLVATSDWKDWASQYNDFTTWANVGITDTNNIVAVEKKSTQTAGQWPTLSNLDQPLRSRLLDDDGNMQISAFNVASYWSGQADQTLGNSLAGDESYDTLSMSLVTKGEQVSMLMFGHIQNRAEQLVINSAKAVIRVVGGARRWGR